MEILAGSGVRKTDIVPCLVNYYMLMINFLTQLDHSDWKPPLYTLTTGASDLYKQKRRFSQISIVWSTVKDICLTK